MRLNRLRGSTLLDVLALLGLLLLIACGGDSSTTSTPQDTIPPARVDDLIIDVITGDAVTLTWTAPGDDGTLGLASRYELRYSGGPLTDVTWDSARVVALSAVPGPAGESERYTVTGMPHGTWHFGLKTVDEVPNWSELSNVVSAAVVDTVPPGQVTDLVVAAVTLQTIRLTWSAPGDDGLSGRASAYDLRHASSPIMEETWNEAVLVKDVPAPGFAGARESFAVADLEPGMTYFFALRTADEVPNWSELSNVVSGSPGERIQITFSLRSFGASSPDWSPNAERIAFVADWIEQGRFQVYAIPVTGEDAVQMTDIALGASNPAWSPDGTRLAFVSFGPGPTVVTDLSVIDAVPGAEPVSIASHGEVSAIGSPSWSPDGNQIAYRVTTIDPPMIVGEIYTVSSQGGPPERLYAENSFISSVDWSPDGRHIAFASDRSGNHDIWLLPVDGGEPVLLTDDPATDSSPVWSPDGSLIAFESDRSGSYDIWIMSSTGLNPTQLTFESADQREPSWSPSGQQICFSATDAMEISDIWILGVN